MEKKYTILRFYRREGKKPDLIAVNQTLAQAQEHCQREDTHKAGVWFDGYQEQD